MKLRIAENSVRLRLDVADLAALEAGLVVVVGYSAPDEAGEMREFRCELCAAAGADGGEHAGPDVVMAPFELRVTLGPEELTSLRDEECEGISLSLDAGDGRPLEVVVEKDRREFRGRGRGGAGGARRAGAEAGDAG